MVYDLIIIGAGPIGLSCGIEAKKKGKSHLILDKSCLVSSIFNFPYSTTFFSASENLEIGNVPFVSQNPKPTRFEALEYYRRVTTHWDLNVNLYEEVLEIDKLEKEFTIKTPKHSYNTKNVIICTGFYNKPNLLNIPGENLPKVKHYYDEPHPYFKQKIIVIGGGNSGVDVALETYRKGADVSLVLKDENIKKTIKYWVKPDIENRIEEGSIKLYKNSKVIAIRPKEIDLKTNKGIITLENDFVLAMIGYHPDFTLLEKSGVTFKNTPLKTPIFNPETFQTQIPNLYLAGVICGGNKTNEWYIDNSRVHPKKIINHIVSK